MQASERLEAAVEARWRHVQLNDELLESIGVHLRRESRTRSAESATEETRLSKRIKDLDTERLNLLRAHLADAVPLDLLKQEQDRIARDLQGTGGFGYDPVFELPDGTRMSSLTPDQKNSLSHRGRAGAKAAAVISEQNVPNA